MKKLILLNLLLLLVSSAMAQESSPREATKTLHVYDWKDLAQQHELPAGEVISMDGMSVLKIENTNNPPSYDGDFLDAPYVFSLLKITNSMIKGAFWVSCEVKYENVWTGNVITTNRFVTGNKAGAVTLLSYIPPSASGGDERVTRADPSRIEGTSNWKLYSWAVNRTAPEGLPTQLELQLSLPGPGIVYLRPVKLLGVTTSWWSAKQGAAVGGVVGVFGGLIGCLGGLLGCLAGFGKARSFVLTTTKMLIALGMLLTTAGIVTIFCGQPYFVWCVFLLPGVILTLVFSLNFPTIQKRYDDLEIRHMASLDA